MKHSSFLIQWKRQTTSPQILVPPTAKLHSIFVSPFEKTSFDEKNEVKITNLYSGVAKVSEPIVEWNI